jgi:hypothetical protein
VGVKPLLRLATHRSAGWLFDVQLDTDPDTRNRLLHDCRRAILGTSIAFELAALADFIVFGTRSHLLYVQLPMLFGAGVARRIVLRKFLLTTRQLRLPAADERIAFSRVPRRLADYTSRTFELCNATISAAALAVVIRAGRPLLLLFTVLVLYLQVGPLLWKAPANAEARDLAGRARGRISRPRRRDVPLQLAYARRRPRGGDAPDADPAVAGNVRRRVE